MYRTSPSTTAASTGSCRGSFLFFDLGRLPAASVQSFFGFGFEAAFEGRPRGRRPEGSPSSCSDRSRARRALVAHRAEPVTKRRLPRNGIRSAIDVGRVERCHDRRLRRGRACVRLGRTIDGNGDGIRPPRIRERAFACSRRTILAKRPERVFCALVSCNGSERRQAPERRERIIRREGVVVDEDFLLGLLQQLRDRRSAKMNAGRSSRRNSGGSGPQRSLHAARRHSGVRQQAAELVALHAVRRDRVRRRVLVRVRDGGVRGVTGRGRSLRGSERSPLSA